MQLSKEREGEAAGENHRIDTYEKDGNLYVKIIDYKSGNKKFQLACTVLMGCNCKLCLYECGDGNRATRKIRGKRLSAALLYIMWRIRWVKCPREMSTEELEVHSLKRKLRMNGIVNDDDIGDYLCWIGNSKRNSDTLPLGGKRMAPKLQIQLR